MCLLKKSTFATILIVFGAGVIAGTIFGFIFHGSPWKLIVMEKYTSAENGRIYPENWTWTVAELEKDWVSSEELSTIEKYCQLDCGGKAERLLKLYPVFDGYNNLAWNIHKIRGNQMDRFNLSGNVGMNLTKSHTDILRLRRGQVGAQFWVAHAPCQSQGQRKDGVVQTLEQIDLIRRLIERYSEDLEFCGTAKCVAKTTFNRSGEKGEGGKIASLIGVEGGNGIENAGVLRQFYRLGVRYVGLADGCNTKWVTSGDKGLIREMNRIGMIIDVSGVSEDLMIAAIWESRSPVILSHSGVKGTCDGHRNLGVKVLEVLKKNGGVIMISFNSDLLHCDKGYPTGAATIKDVILRIEWVRNVTGGTDNIGLGADFDGMDVPAVGLEDVGKYPELFAALLFRGWDLKDLRKIAYLNMLRVMEDVERVKGDMARNGSVKIFESRADEGELMQKGFLGFDGKKNCLSN